MMKSAKKLTISFLLLTAVSAWGADWKPVEGRIMTRWAKQVSADAPLPEYPRPQLRRDEWKNLNGLWQYAVTERNALQPGGFDGEILVPYAIESALSGVGKTVTPDQALWYRRSFDVPAGWNGKRIKLNFGAVDWHARVWVNGVAVGEHKGGYTPFSLDVTKALRSSGSQELTVWVWDPSNTGTQGRGKQVLDPQGIWYTAVTGIWQTVWIEPVPEVSIEQVMLTPDVDGGRVRVGAALGALGEGLRLVATVRDGDRQVAQRAAEAGEEMDLAIADAKLWSPDSPHLYDVTLRLMRGGEEVDRVDSYFGMRKIALGKDEHGDLRLFLNNQALFQIGPLDQGWWPDGLYTAPTDEALKYDIEITKKLSFNMARKHVKVEPARWYYWCDKLGLMVWQDMPSAYLGGRGPTSGFVGPWSADWEREGVSASQWESEWREIIDSFKHFPSIVMWVPFNEGWGQYDTARIAAWTKQYDPTRLVNAASGWTDRGSGDVYDTHLYPGPGMQYAGADRAIILGEFGGLGWPVEDHLWWNKRNWGYRTLTSRRELADKYEEVLHNVVGPYHKGLAAAIYTQTTDVEGEVNGLMTYDRELVKFDEKQLAKLHGEFFKKSQGARAIAQNSVLEQQEWDYTFNQPAEGWASASSSDSSWMRGKAPFRSEPDDGLANGDSWPAGSIWARRTFTVDEIPANLWLEALHSTSTGTVYLNGKKIADLEGRTRREYGHHDVSEFVKLLKKGKNVLAVHADQGDPTREDRRDLDVGLYSVK